MLLYVCQRAIVYVRDCNALRRSRVWRLYQTFTQVSIIMLFMYLLELTGELCV